MHSNNSYGILNLHPIRYIALLTKLFRTRLGIILVHIAPI